MTRELAIQHATHAYDDGSLLAELAGRVAYPTESEVPEQGPRQHAYLNDNLVPALAELGFSCQVHPNPAGMDLPILVARRIEDPLPVSYTHLTLPTSDLV